VEKLSSATTLGSRTGQVRLELRRTAATFSSRQACNTRPKGDNTNRLQCVGVECGRVSQEDERGWRAYLTDREGDEPEEAVVYCAVCSEREFGSASGASR
jgi:hypothetical protein